MSTPTLSVVIACHNDPDIANTIQSIHNTTGSGLISGDIEVAVVDDASPRPVQYRTSTGESVHINIIRNARRIGCGPSRYVGALAAKGEWLLFVDAHSRFPAGWFETWKAECGMAAKTLYCGRCLGLGKNSAGVMNMDVDHPNGEYSGATWNFCGPYRSGLHAGNPRHVQVLECVWDLEKPERTYEIPACMGACYVINREFFIRLDALRHLRLLGGDEQELSLKVWLAGGSIVLMKSLRVGHKFQEGKGPPPHVILYNKMLISETCLPPDYARRLRPRFQREQQYNIANRALASDWHIVECQRAYNSTIFTRSFEEYLAKFSLSFPSS